MSQSTPTSRQLSPSRPEVSRAKSVSRYNSRASSRPRYSRNSSRASNACVPAPENLILPDGAIGEETAELLHEFVHPHHRDENTSLFGGHNNEESSDVGGESDAGSVELRDKLPWYKRPSPLWFLVFVPLTAAATGATMAPRVEIFTRMACEVHKIGRGNNTSIGISQGSAMFSPDDEMRLCSSDPVVLAEVAKLTMALSLCLGVLSCLTTAWWGSLSDRYGRTRILGCCVFGLLMTDVNFLVVSKYHKILPGGYWFILLGPILDGLLGGMTAVTAAIHAYIADCTEAGSRSRVFSLFLGLMFIGIGIGPTMGSVIIRLTGTPISVFYVATFQHIIYAALIVVVIPESLSVRRMLEARRLHDEALDMARRTPKTTGFLTSLKKSFKFLSPLSLFFPKPTSPDANPLKPSRHDWNLVLLAVSFGCAISLMGSYNYELQYTSAAFGWTSEQIGYWLSIVGFTRAIYLTAVLPLLIKLLKPKPKPAIQLSVEPDEPLQPEGSSSPTQAASASLPRNPDTHSLVFDLWLARSSLAIEIMPYTLLPFAPNGITFTVLTMLGALGSGFSPAVQSVTLGLYTQSGGVESGKLFGALSVVQALCSQIIGPTMFGITFMRTAANFPAAIFFLTSGAVTFAFIALAFVRLPTGTTDEEDLQDLDRMLDTVPESQEDRPVDADVPTIVIEHANNKSASPSL